MTLIAIDNFISFHYRFLNHVYYLFRWLLLTLVVGSHSFSKEVRAGFMRAIFHFTIILWGRLMNGVWPRVSGGWSQIWTSCSSSPLQPPLHYLDFSCASSIYLRRWHPLAWVVTINIECIQSFHPSADYSQVRSVRLFPIRCQRQSLRIYFLKEKIRIGSFPISENTSSRLCYSLLCSHSFVIIRIISPYTQREKHLFRTYWTDLVKDPIINPELKAWNSLWGMGTRSGKSIYYTFV